MSSRSALSSPCSESLSGRYSGSLSSGSLSSELDVESSERGVRSLLWELDVLAAGLFSGLLSWELGVSAPVSVTPVLSESKIGQFGRGHAASAGQCAAFSQPSTQSTSDTSSNWRRDSQ